MQNQKLMITGAGGFLGRNLCEFYEGKYDVIPTDRMISFAWEIGRHQPDYIIHAAAEIYDPEKMYETNVVMTKRILDLARFLAKKPTKIILLGSSSEYGRCQIPISEKQPVNPSNMYETTKVMASLLAEEYSRLYKLPITLVRPFSIVGRYEKPHKLFPTLWHSYKNNLPIKMAPGMHDFVFIDDFLKAFDKVLRHKEHENFNIVNIGSGVQYSNYDVVNTFEDYLKYRYDGQLVEKLREQDSDNWICNNSLLRNKYGYNKFDNLNFGVVRFVNDCQLLDLYK